MYIVFSGKEMKTSNTFGVKEISKFEKQVERHLNKGTVYTWETVLKKKRFLYLPL